MLIKLDNGGYVNTEHISMIMDADNLRLPDYAQESHAEWYAVVGYNMIPLTGADRDRLLQAMAESPFEIIAGELELQRLNTEESKYNENHN